MLIPKAFAEPLLPRASQFAAQYDLLFNVTLAICTIIFIGTMIVTGYFGLKYLRKKEGEVTPRIEGNHTAEILWSVIPLFLVIWAFVVGWIYYKDSRAIASDHVEIQVTGKQWLWAVQYPNGIQMTNQIVVPLNKGVRILTSSTDVIHGFYIPAFSTHVATQPGMYTEVDFVPTQLGEFDFFCTQYCGGTHANMIGKIKVVDPVEYERWYQSKGDFAQAGKGELVPPAMLGEKLYATANCIACHSVDGSRKIGASFHKLFGSKRELANGEVVEADENYLRESLLYPNKKLVKGYGNVMPTYRGVLTDPEINSLIAYIKSLQ